jgi:hypothetical protein
MNTRSTAIATAAVAALLLARIAVPVLASSGAWPHPAPRVHVHTRGRAAGWRDPGAVFPLRETARREQSFRLPGGKGRIVVDDVAGNVEVRGVDGDTVRVVATQTVRAAVAEDVALARQEMPLQLTQRGSSVVAYVDAPFRDDDGGIHFGDDDDVPYRVVYDFVIEAPRGVAVDLRTVLDGDVQVRDLDGAFEVRNVNGEVTLVGMASAGTASTVNGELHVAFRRNPDGACDFGNVNGNVDVSFAPGLAADVRYHTLNGEAWSDFPFTLVPTKPLVNEDAGKGRYRVKSEWQEGIRIGAGGPLLSFDTVNGNIYLRQRG